MTKQITGMNGSDASCTDKSGSVKDLAEHTFEWKVDKEATETATGLKHEECSVCGYKRNENTVIEKIEKFLLTSRIILLLLYRQFRKQVTTATYILACCYVYKCRFTCRCNSCLQRENVLKP